MSRVTRNEVQGLMEAYNNVYAPQELTEEQVWEEVETWVNSLLEEGYDLSDYTWEEMYEAYVTEFLGSLIRAAVTKAGPKLASAFSKAAPKVASAAKSGFRNFTSGAKPELAKAAQGAGKFAVKRGIPIASVAALDKAVFDGNITKTAGNLAQTGVNVTKAGTGKLAKETEKLEKATAKLNKKSKDSDLYASYEYNDAFDLVLEYLLSQGHVDTLDEALYVMMEMNADTIQGIVEQVTGDGSGKPMHGDYDDTKRTAPPSVKKKPEVTGDGSGKPMGGPYKD